MPRINIYLDDEESKKLDKFSEKWKVKSKEDVIKKMIRGFPEDKNLLTDFDVDKETQIW